MREQTIPPDRKKIIIGLVMLAAVLLLVFLLATCSFFSPAPSTAENPYNILEKNVDAAFDGIDDGKKVPGTEPLKN